MSSVGSDAYRGRALDPSGKVGVITIYFLPFQKTCQRETELRRCGGRVSQIEPGGVCEDGGM